MDYSKSSICDYITLYFADGVSDGVSLLTFNIPDTAYMNNSRGDYALVSLVDGGVIKNSNDHILVGIKNILNNSSPNNSLLPPLGHFVNQNNATDYKHKLITNNIAYLTPPRPPQITLETFGQDKSKKLVTNGYVTLKFDYLSKPALIKENKDNAFTSAFPQPYSF